MTSEVSPRKSGGMIKVSRDLPTLLLLALALIGCSDSTEPAETVPRQLYYIKGSGSYPYSPWYDRLYGLALDGSGSVQVIPDSTLAKFNLNQYFPPWISPDGRQIKLITGYSDSTASILTVDQFGSVLSVIPFPDGVPFDPRAAFSPDGTRLAWFGKGYLNLAAVDGSGIQKIYFDSLASFAGGDVAWSRDGRWLAYATWHYSQLAPYTPMDIRLWTRRLSDGFARPIANLGEVAQLPAWSRDGRWLTFISGGEIHRVRSDGSGTEQVVYADASRPAQSASWGDGDSLLAVAAVPGIVLIRPDGGGQRTLLTVQGGLMFVSWRAGAPQWGTF